MKLQEGTLLHWESSRLKLEYKEDQILWVKMNIQTFLQVVLTNLLDFLVF